LRAFTSVSQLRLSAKSARLGEFDVVPSAAATTPGGQTPRNWSRVKRGVAVRIRAAGYWEEGFQWAYWSFAGGLDGDLIVTYSTDGGTGFIGKLRDATIEELD
jgi:hypothetical protein